MTNSLGVGIPALDGLLRFDNFCAKEMRQPRLSHFGRPLLFAGERRDVALNLLRVLKRTAPRLPAPLIAVLLAIVASRFFDLGSHGVALLGVIPAGLPKLMAPQIGLKDL